LLALGLVLLTNMATVKLAIVGALLAATYPYFKRFTHLPQVVLGVAFGWSIPMAFTAQTGQLPAVTWWIFAINMVWVVIYDTLYAMVDREDDLRIGIKSTAILFGVYDLAVLRVLMVLMVLMLTRLGLYLQFGIAWYTALAFTLVLFIIQQWRIRRRHPQACFHAFLGNNYVGMVVFAGIAVDYLLR
jgi:4-hydroxybenzoate polyprenyltransferase